VKPEAVPQDGEPAVTISDAFLGLENKEPSYKKQDTGAGDVAKATEDKDKEEDDDFERDEDEGEVANVMEEDDDGLKKTHNAIITKENNTVKVNVNINVSSISATKKSMAEVNAKSKEELEADKKA
jgi:hypothetical protein